MTCHSAHGLPVVFDFQALREERIDRDQLVKLNVRDMPLIAVLDSILELPYQNIGTTDLARIRNLMVFSFPHAVGELTQHAPPCGSQRFRFSEA